MNRTSILLPMFNLILGIVDLTLYFSGQDASAILLIPGVICTLLGVGGLLVRKEK